MSQLQTTFRSSVNTWQCDENDHLNVQFFTAFADDASIQMLILMGLDPATLRPQSDHIRYWKELRGEDAVEIVSAPIEVSAHGIALYHELRNGYDGSLSATCIRTATSRTPLSAELMARATAAMVALPKHGKPRSAGRFGELPDLTMDQALGAGMREINRCVVAPEECDAQGNLRPRFHFSRFSDGAAMLWHGLGFDRVAMRDNKQGTVVLETRTAYRKPIKVGTPTAVISGLLDHTDKALHIGHLLFDAASGEVCATGEAVGVLFDQEARRSMAMSEADRTRMSGRIVTALRGNIASS